MPYGDGEVINSILTEVVRSLGNSSKGVCQEAEKLIEVLELSIIENNQRKSNDIIAQAYITNLSTFVENTINGFNDSVSASLSAVELSETKILKTMGDRALNILAEVYELVLPDLLIGLYGDKLLVNTGYDRARQNTSKRNALNALNRTISKIEEYEDFNSKKIIADNCLCTLPKLIIEACHRESKEPLKFAVAKS